MAESVNILDTISDTTVYHLEAELGSGGGGTVYKAWHEGLKKYVVIKEIHSDLKQDIETERNEVEALKNVKSAYLPQVLGFIEKDGRAFTVIEFVEGESLDKHLERGCQFSQAQVVKWYGQLASALEVIHKQGIAHCDIKPANIMLLPNGDVCLIDFNVALVGGNDIQLVSRSLGYASPEQYEIYERKKKEIDENNTDIGTASASEAKTELTDDNTVRLMDICKTECVSDNKTERIKEEDQETELLNESDTTQKTELVSESEIEKTDWKRSDIYSLGATMYHLLSGEHPPEKAEEVVPISKLGSFGEGIVYIIEQSMRIEPSERFASGEVLSKVIKNIYKYDTFWKKWWAKMVAAVILLPLAFALFAGTMLLGKSVMAQEKEEQYYAALYEVEHGSDPEKSYEEALEIFENRIDPYRVMAERLWNDGDLNGCITYIESNLGNIAEFQTMPDTVHSFGEIYYILGNCYCYQPDQPDYAAIVSIFEIVVQCVKDNPVYYRDYAIALAKKGDVQGAERALEKAHVLGVDASSRNLLEGELAYARQEYDNALEHFAEVISQADDDYIRYRAYHSSDEIFKIKGQPERSVALLSEGLSKIPVNRIPEMTERLADAYVKCGQNEQAIILFEQLIEDGALQFHLWQNLVVLLQQEGEMERAEKCLEKMSDLFPNDYRVPMRRAYLEADKQFLVPNEERDYSAMKQYYDMAVKFYDQNAKLGNFDPEMQQLDMVIEQLRINRWID